MGYDFVGNYVNYKVDFDLTLKGKENPTLVLENYQSVLAGMKAFINQKQWDRVHEKLENSFELGFREKSSYALADRLMSNFQQFGKKEIFTAGAVPLKFEQGRVNKILQTMVNSKFMAITSGQFKSAKKFTVDTRAELKGGYKSILTNSMIPVQYLGSAISSVFAKSKQVTLTSYNKLFDVAYGYKFMPKITPVYKKFTVDLSNPFSLSQATVEQVRQASIQAAKEESSTESMSSESMTSATESIAVTTTGTASVEGSGSYVADAEVVQETVLVNEASFLAIENKKYLLPQVTMAMVMFPSIETSKNKLTATKMDIQAAVWNLRCAEINNKLKQFRGYIDFVPSRNKVTMLMTVPKENAKKALELTYTKVLKTKEFSEIELKNLLEASYEQTIQARPAFYEVIMKFKESINEYTPSVEERIKQLKQFSASGMTAVSMKAGYVYSEGFVDSGIQTAISDFALKYDPTFAVKRVFDRQVYVDAVSGFKNKGTQAIECVKQNKDDASEAFLVMYQAAKTTDIKAQARLRLINAYMNTEAFAELRAKQRLGYVANSIVETVGDQDMLGVVVEGLKIDQIKSGVEKFVADFYVSLKGLNANDFKTIRTSVQSQLREGAGNLQDEALQHFSYAYEQLPIDFNLKLANELDIVTQADLLDFYDKNIIKAKGRIEVKTNVEASSE